MQACNLSTYLVIYLWLHTKISVAQSLGLGGPTLNLLLPGYLLVIAYRNCSRAELMRADFKCIIIIIIRYRCGIVNGGVVAWWHRARWRGGIVNEFLKIKRRIRTAHATASDDITMIG